MLSALVARTIQWKVDPFGGGWMFAVEHTPLFYILYSSRAVVVVRRSGSSGQAVTGCDLFDGRCRWSSRVRYSANVKRSGVSGVRTLWRSRWNSLPVDIAFCSSRRKSSRWPRLAVSLMSRELCRRLCPVGSERPRHAPRLC